MRHIWWIGVALFLPSILVWGLILYAELRTGIRLPLDAHMARHLYLPLLAAIVGLSVPLFCLYRLRTASPRVSGGLFALYLALVVTWGVIDIRCLNYQIGGHDYPNGVLSDGAPNYFHIYNTWYFLPYKWIEPDTESRSQRQLEVLRAAANDYLQERAAEDKKRPASNHDAANKHGSATD